MSPGSDRLREAHLVELVDDAGLPVGQSTVDDAHRAPGRLHRAFSVLLVDDYGRLLLQQRATAKTRFALCWANACCGHPAPGEPVAVAAARRLEEELGVELGADLVTLSEIGTYVYRAQDPRSGRVEHEFDHVFVGRASVPFRLMVDPAEVAAIAWVEPARLAADLAADPERYAPWLAGVVDTWRSSTVR